jgi:hypothetical protein
VEGTVIGFVLLTGSCSIERKALVAEVGGASQPE